MKIKLNKGYDQFTINSVQQKLKIEVDIINSKTSFGLGDLTSLGILSIALINFIYTVSKDNKNKWDESRLKSTIADELLKINVIHHKLKTIRGYENLMNKNSASPCVVEIVDENSKEYTFKIYYSGGIYLIDNNK